jgi:hypothetical protein
MMIDSATVAIYGLLTVLGVWSATWLVLGISKAIADKQRKIYWYTHAGWVGVNLCIVSVGLITLGGATFDREFVTLQRNIVGVNAALDIGYLFIAKWLQTKSRLSMKQIGEAVYIQGLFLLVLDVVFTILLTILLASTT